MFQHALRLIALLLITNTTFAQPAKLRVATFDVDATPPVGSHMTYRQVTGPADLSLRCRGLAILGAGEPIVLCAVDWIGIANEGHDEFRDALAKAAGTTRQRVAVHTLHQHDAPVCDFGAEAILRENGLVVTNYDSKFARETIARAAESLAAGLKKTQPWTHFGHGSAEVKEVASNRRILGPDGKVKAVRFTTCRDPLLRAEPEGTIDPRVQVLSFWSSDRPIAVVSYYATHPQSYYGTGIPSPDFPGIARFLRNQAEPKGLHIHFCGAGGNVGAGKYNDGSTEARTILALRLADGMKRAWDATEKQPVEAKDVGWSVEPVALPMADHLKKDELTKKLSEVKDHAAFVPGLQASWFRRCEKGHKIDIACLRVGSSRVLHAPGELFVEYQLAAQKMRPDLKVAMAAYGDYGPMYIGTEIAYGQGGYETRPATSFVAPHVEGVLLGAFKKLLAE